MTSPVLRARDGMYEFGGVRVPSVSTVLAACVAKPALVSWAARCVAEAALTEPVVMQYADNTPGLTRDDAIRQLAAAPFRARNAAGDRGTKVHAIAEAIARGETVADDAVPEALRPFVAPLRAAIAQHAIRFEASEVTVWNGRVGYAGTLDAIVTCRIADGGGRGVRAILDYKTRESEAKAVLYSETVLQLAAYSACDQAITLAGATLIPSPPRFGAVLHLWPGGYRLDVMRLRTQDRAAFKHAVELWRWMHERKTNGKENGG